VIGIDPEYFLDEMSQDEIIAIYKARYEFDNNEEKSNWEKTRDICYYAFIAMQGNERYKKPSDLFKFPWEQQTKEKGMTSKEAQKKLSDGKS